MTELQLEYENKLKEYELQERHEGGDADAPIQPPILRSRQEVRKKLYDMGLASDARDFGKIRRTRKTKKVAIPQFEELDGGILKETKNTGKRKSFRRKRKPDSDDEELVHVMSEEEEVSFRKVD